MTTGERIKTLRSVLNLSQPKFGEKIGVSKAVIVNLEIDRVELKDYMINLICRTFDVNPAWLKDEEGQMFLDTPNILIDNLAVEYNLNPTETKIISNFVNLSESERNQIIEIVKKLIT